MRMQNDYNFPQIEKNFDIREFVPRSIYQRFGKNSTWFIDPMLPKLAQFYKDFFTYYFKTKDPNVSHVLIKINTWHYEKNGFQNRGFRFPNTKIGAKLSQHKFANAFDCEIIIVYYDGTQKEVDYKEIHQVIKQNESAFMDKGLTTLESVKIAKGWLHSDMRWIPNQTEILIIEPWWNQILPFEKIWWRIRIIRRIAVIRIVSLEIHFQS